MAKERFYCLHIMLSVYSQNIADLEVHEIEPGKYGSELLQRSIFIGRSSQHYKFCMLTMERYGKHQRSERNWND